MTNSQLLSNIVSLIYPPLQSKSDLIYIPSSTSALYVSLYVFIVSYCFAVNLKHLPTIKKYPQKHSSHSSPLSDNYQQFGIYGGISLHIDPFDSYPSEHVLHI